MSAKAQFFQKLNAARQEPSPAAGRAEADIGAFCQQMNRLYDDIRQWLEGADLSVTAQPVTVVELLLGNRRFPVTGITVSLEDRALVFTPLYLYGQGVTGCTEVSLVTSGQKQVLQRLLRRSGGVAGWTCTSPEAACSHPRPFDEDVFFGLLAHLIP